MGTTHHRGSRSSARATTRIDLAIANVGDSRAYLLRDGELTQLTEDHSLVQDCVRDGQLTAEEAAVHPQRNILTRVLGQRPRRRGRHLRRSSRYEGDRFVLCSDGLFDEVDDDDDRRRSCDGSPTRRGRRASSCGWPRAHGGGDNITVVVVDVVDDDDRAGRSRRRPTRRRADAGPRRHDRAAQRS